MELLFISTMMEMALVVLVLAILFVAGQLLRHQKGKISLAGKRSLIAVEAKAIVLAIEQTGLFLNHRPQVKMQVQVLPERHRNFVAEVKEVLSFMDLAAIRTGSAIKVRYNPANIKDVVLVAASF